MAQIVYLENRTYLFVTLDFLELYEQLQAIRTGWRRNKGTSICYVTITSFLRDGNETAVQYGLRSCGLVRSESDDPPPKGRLFSLR